MCIQLINKQRKLLLLGRHHTHGAQQKRLELPAAPVTQHESKHKVDKSKHEVDKSKHKVDKSKHEVDKSKHKVDKSKHEVDTFEDEPLVELLYQVFAHMPDESYCRCLRSLLLCLRDVFQMLINSIMCS